MKNTYSYKFDFYSLMEALEQTLGLVASRNTSQSVKGQGSFGSTTEYNLFDLEKFENYLCKNTNIRSRFKELLDHHNQVSQGDSPISQASPFSGKNGRQYSILDKVGTALSLNVREQFAILRKHWQNQFFAVPRSSLFKGLEEISIFAQLSAAWTGHIH